MPFQFQLRSCSGSAYCSPAATSLRQQPDFQRRQSLDAESDDAVFIDIEIPAYNVASELVEAAITPQTYAIMAAHALRDPLDAASIGEIASGIAYFSLKTAPTRLRMACGDVRDRHSELISCSTIDGRRRSGLCQPSRIAEAMDLFATRAGTAPFLRERRARA
ncbi:DegT/DnrJ/EryC1/StrS family aminotransferase [Bradyrhizobium erythrophlei]|uniref:DegT/DnrJ/EryC1/StrS family aminotransferase n=1 Tax=Bradyrhizobium erythrophlei TaxID=1437360 RepID=UPI0035F0322C